MADVNTIGEYPRYLGDGVYASFDGYQVWVEADRDERRHSVALDHDVMAALHEYYRTILTRYHEANEEGAS